MDNQIILTIIAFFGTAIGTGGGIFYSSKLTNYRIEQLEKKVDKHNMVIQRTFALEEWKKTVDEDIRTLGNN